ncbi:hypothetical protein IJ843_03150 [bacterium]|nr:hypothetical protein [bacterium]
MAITILIFDYKKAEQNFFKKNRLDDYDIHFFEESLNENTVNNLPDELLEETTVISVYLTSEINDNVLKKFSNLMILSTRSAGYEHINIQECCNKRIKVLNVENYDSKAIVQYTFCLMIALIRKLMLAERDVRSFNFEYNSYIGRELDKLTLGIIGTGSVGSEMCRIAHAFGMKILALDLKQNSELVDNYGVKYTDKTTLLENSDVISLHVPLNEKTREILTKREFAITKPDAIVINTSRGELINTADLYNAIIKGNLAGAGLDAMECEEIAFGMQNITTKIKNANADCMSKLFLTRKLAQLDNVIITPRIAYSTQDSIDRILETTFDSIEDCIQGGHTNQVN